MPILGFPHRLFEKKAYKNVPGEKQLALGLYRRSPNLWFQGKRVKIPGRFLLVRLKKPGLYARVNNAA